MACIRSRENPRRFRPINSAHQHRPVADDETIGNDVVLDRTHTADKRMFADAAKLMERGTAAEDDITPILQ